MTARSIARRVDRVNRSVTALDIFNAFRISQAVLQKSDITIVKIRTFRYSLDEINISLFRQLEDSR